RARCENSPHQCCCGNAEQLSPCQERRFGIRAGPGHGIFLLRSKWSGDPPGEAIGGAPDVVSPGGGSHSRFRAPARQFTLFTTSDGRLLVVSALTATVAGGSRAARHGR